MKSRIDNGKNDEIILSIGMIVKNEEKVLRRCLDSLQPLMTKISSELIIADTGSTDSTVEIAREYTDNVLYFEWINDFAAARNSTLSRASGKWYLFIDADEYFDNDISELITFLNNKELSTKYTALEIKFRNYFNHERTRYADSYLPRLFKMYDGITFVGSIHETINIIGKTAYSDVIIHHTGYCYTSETEKEKKSKRNRIPLLEEYNENPNDLRVLCLMLSEFFEDAEMMKELSEKAIELSRENRKHFCSNVNYMLVISYLRSINPEKALELCEEFFYGNRQVYNSVSAVSIYYLKSFILSDIGRFEKSNMEFQNYFAFYKKYLNNQLAMDDLFNRPLYGLSEAEYYKGYFTSVLCLVNLLKYDEAMKILKEIDYQSLDIEHLKIFLQLLIKICVYQKEYYEIANCYKLLEKTNDNEKKRLMLCMLESTFFSLYGDEREVFAKSICDSELTGEYIQLLKLYNEQQTSNFNERLYDFFGRITDWTEGYSLAVLLALKHKIDISEFIINRIKPLDFRKQLTIISDSEDNFANYVLSYGCPLSFLENITSFYWLVTLYEKASMKCYKLNDDEKYIIYMNFINLLGDYVINIYNPDLLNDDDICVIPELHRFGYYSKKSIEYLKLNNMKEFLNNIKKAFYNCQTMGEIVKFIIRKNKNIN